MKFLIPVFLVGVLGLAFSVNAYQPLDPGGMLLGIFIVCLTALIVLTTADADEKINLFYLVSALVPWLLSLAFVTNGALDHSQEMNHHTVVLEEHFNSPRWWVGDSIVVRSWQPGRSTERVYLRGMQGFYDPGEGVTISIRSGALGIAWVSGVLRDGYPRNPSQR